MLLDQRSRLVEVFPRFWVFLFQLAFFGQLQKNVILNVLELNLWDSSINDSFPESINMNLKQGDRLDQKIITSTNQVHIQQQMISDQTVHPFIIRNGISWPHFNNNLLVSVPLNGTLDFIERKDIVRISEKFKLSIQFWVVVNGKHFTWCWIQFNLPEINAVWTESYVESVRKTFHVEIYLVAAFTDQFCQW
jgi:hypothetical protein